MTKKGKKERIKVEKSHGGTICQVDGWIPWSLRDPMAIQDKDQYVAPQVISVTYQSRAVKFVDSKNVVRNLVADVWFYSDD